MTSDWTDRLSEYLDGTLSPAEQAACEAWLAASADGRALLEELRRVVAKAKTLPDAPVPDSVWAGISKEIGGRTRERPTDVVPIGARAPAARRWSFTPMQLAAAAAVLVAIGAGVAIAVRPRITIGTKTPIALAPDTP